MAKKSSRRKSAKAAKAHLGARAKPKRRRPARPPMPVPASLVLSTANHLTKAGAVFAHGTADPVAEAAFMVSEVLGIHPDRLEERAFRPLTPAQKERLVELIAERIVTRKPAAYLLHKAYMR